MSYLVIFSFMALIFERILELLDKLYQHIFSPQEDFQKSLSEKILNYKGRAEEFKKTFRSEIENYKDKPISDAELNTLLQISQGYVSMSEEEIKDLIIIWNQQQVAQRKHVAVKMTVMWILGFALGLGFCFLVDFRLLGPLGVESLLPKENENGIPISIPVLDYILTAILLSCGTKPIHDLLSMLSSKAKVKL